MTLEAGIAQRLKFLYMATEIVASGFGVGEAGAQCPEHTQQYVRSTSTVRLRSRVAQ